METPILDGALFILARIVEFINIGMIILFAVRGVPARYIYAVLSVTVISLLFFVVSLLFRSEDALKLSFLVTVGAFVVMILIARHALSKASIDIILPEASKCPVCSAFVKQEGAIALHVGHSYLFFDQEEHLRKFLESPEDYAKIRRMEIKSDMIGKAYVYKNGVWLELKNT